MTIDERLERLTERHEALAQALELTASMQRGAAKRLEENEKPQKERDIQYNERFNRILDIVETQAVNIDNLAAIARDHEHRIQRQENR
ncbi:MAG: hypothetical protein ABSF54_24795 [Bryobacteraceae bacterium]|jgi:hypothetical protein